MTVPAVPVATTEARSRWSMPTFLRASVALHVLAALAWLAQPAWWPALLGLVVLNHVLITALGLWPRSDWLGPNLRRLGPAATARGEIALTFDDGPDEAMTPWVLDQLERHGQRASFFCIAERVRRHPALAREIVARGHSLQNHSDRHRHDFSLLGPRGLRADLVCAQATLEQAAGSPATCFRAPAGLRNPFLDPVLHRLGLTLVSWTRRGFDTRERDAATVLARLTRNLAAGDILLLHDGHGARDAQGAPVLQQVLPALLERCKARGLRSVTLPEGLADLADYRARPTASTHAGTAQPATLTP